VNSEKSLSIDASLAYIQETFGVVVQTPSLYLQALTHSSALSSIRRPRQDEHYERLEFLGDAALDLAIGHLLLDFFPRASEGELSKMRAALVCTASLAEVAHDIGLPQHIRRGKGDMVFDHSFRDSILADVIEAIIGALYVDHGFTVTLTSIRHVWGNRIASVTPLDPKTDLQELLHTQGFPPPQYFLVESTGPKHAPVYLSTVQVQGIERGRGEGPSKKKSQQEAAKVALEFYKRSS
jgi:ribonuclease III